ncbi:MAG TPA: hypothetical protein VKT75_19395 [Acidobacteriaceae bacterium]|nr:hypothetical protein [Acidobacteriaceae bacterium]
MSETVTAAYAKANLPKLLKQAEKGKTIVVSRYRKPIAMIAPAPQPLRRTRQLGTGKGRIRILDPHWADPMTDAEVEQLLEDRH